MSLQAELDAFRADYMKTLPPDTRDAMLRADAQLAASGVVQRGGGLGTRRFRGFR
jgi:hypothetical protein